MAGSLNIQAVVVGSCQRDLRRSNFFWVFRLVRKNSETQLLTLSRLDICLSVRMEQFGSQWTDFREI